MPDYRRAYVPGGTFFFTVVTYRRARFLCQPQARRCLRWALRLCRGRWPFTIDAMVLLPDHLHTIWTLPGGDADFSKRWAWVKRSFTRQWLRTIGVEQVVSRSSEQGRRRGIWQRLFWEHTITDEADLERHMDYIHYNPVRHGLAAGPGDWPWSSFHRLVRLGIYPPDWGQHAPLNLKFDDLEKSAME